MTTQEKIKASTSLPDRLNNATTQDIQKTSTSFPVCINMTTQDENETRASTSSSSPAPPPSPPPPPPAHSIKDKINKTLKNLWFGFTTLLSMVMFVVDVVSDILLAVRYLRNGHRFWGAFTTAFISIPWALLGVLGAWTFVVFGIDDSYREMQMLMVCSVFGMLPIGWSLLSLKYLFVSANEDKAKLAKHYAVQVCFIEVFFEAVPQLCLQVYICGATNQVDFILAISIVSSLVSITMGMVNFFICHIENEDFMNITRYRATVLREVAFTLLFHTWTILHVITSLPPLALLASLRHHASPAHLTLALYISIHLVATVFFSFVIPINGTKDLCSFHSLLPFHTYLQRDFEPHPRLRLASRFVGIILQIIFFIVTNTISAQWIVSLAPFLPHVTTSAIPSFIWPQPLPFLRNWVITNATDLVPSTSNSSLLEFVNCSVTRNETRFISGISKKKIFLGLTTAFLCYSILNYRWLPLMTCLPGRRQPPQGNNFQFHPSPFALPYLFPV
jgi:hypothetical protein